MLHRKILAYRFKKALRRRQKRVKQVKKNINSINVSNSENVCIARAIYNVVFNGQSYPVSGIISSLVPLLSGNRGAIRESITRNIAKDNASPTVDWKRISHAVLLGDLILSSGSGKLYESTSENGRYYVEKGDGLSYCVNLMLRNHLLCAANFFVDEGKRLVMNLQLSDEVISHFSNSIEERPRKRKGFEFTARLFSMPEVKQIPKNEGLLNSPIVYHTICVGVLILTVVLKFRILF